MNPNTLNDLLASLLDAGQQATQPLTTSRIALAIALSFVISVGVAGVYRFCYKGTVARNGPILSMILASMVTTLIIMPISTSILLSMGMVGALSIVRFRTAMKDPTDIAFLFWVIAVGVCNGAGFFNVSIIGSLVIGVLLMLFSLVSIPTREPVLLVVRYDPAFEAAITDVLPKGRMLSKTVRPEHAELTLELRRALPPDLTNTLIGTEGVADVAVVCYNGSYLAP